MTTDNIQPTPASAEEIAEAEGHFWGPSPWGSDPISGLVDDVWHERARQLNKWGLQERPSGTDLGRWLEFEEIAKAEHDIRVQQGTLTWVDILKEEVYEAFAEEDPDALRVELIQVMAVAASWILDLDRRGDL